MVHQQLSGIDGLGSVREGSGRYLCDQFFKMLLLNLKHKTKPPQKNKNEDEPKIGKEGRILV